MLVHRLPSPRRAALVVALALAGGIVLIAPGRALAGTTYEFVGTANVSPTGSPSPQDSIGCASANDCVIVGSDLAKSFDGHHVTAIPALDGRPTTRPADGIDPNDWHAASCASDGACMIVSVDGLASGHSAFRASATAPWIRAAMPIPPGFLSTGRWEAWQSVSCSSATFCLAVATWTDDDLIPQVWRWDGAAWHLGNLRPSAPGPGAVYFSGVSCAAAWQCVVVGQRNFTLTSSSIGLTAFRAVLDGNTWSVANLPTPSGSTAEADAVSCWSIQHCRIVGNVSSLSTQSNNVTAWKWSGQEFTEATGFEGSNPPEVDSMSCTSDTFCIAAGSQVPVGTHRSEHLDLLWNGTTWTSLVIHRAALSGSGTVNTSTNGVACSTAYACRLVGHDGNGSDQDTFLDSLQAT